MHSGAAPIGGDIALAVASLHKQAFPTHAELTDTPGDTSLLGNTWGQIVSALARTKLSVALKWGKPVKLREAHGAAGSGGGSFTSAARGPAASTRKRWPAAHPPQKHERGSAHRSEGRQGPIAKLCSNMTDHMGERLGVPGMGHM